MAESICTVPFNLSESRTVKCTSQWFVDESEYDALECTYELLICGEEAFGAVYEAIKNARTSVFIACWGFQPSMYFVKHGRAQSLRSTVYGDDSCLAIGQLLEKKAHEGVKVRLLCWADRVLGSNISLVPISGEVNTQGMGSITGNSRNFGATEEQYAYDKDFFDAYVRNLCMGGNPSNWFRRTFLERGKENAFGKKANLLENLQLRLRGFGPADRLEALWGHGEHASAAARALYAAAASHHQKMVLVDYEDPENHVGFVMGHNMLDEYWDTRAHSYYRKAPWEGRNGLLPREDVSARITGPCVGNLFYNFKTAWEMSREGLATVSAGGAVGGAVGMTVATGNVLQDRLDVAREVAKWPEVDFNKHKLHLVEGGDLSFYACMAQIVRTQPQLKPQVEDIKKMYLQNVENATNYIYFENQYFRWLKLADVLTAHAAKLTADGRKPFKHKSLYLFVVTNSSEEGMGAGAEKTRRMLDSLGRADTMPVATRSGLEDDLKRNEEERNKLQEAQAAIERQRAADKNSFGKQPGLKARWDELRADLAREEARQAALQRQKEELEARQAALEEDKNAPIAPEERPGLKIHVCTLVPPDTPPRTKAGESAREVDKQIERARADLAYLAQRTRHTDYDEDRSQKERLEKRLAELEQQRRTADTWKAPEEGVADDIWRWPETYIHSKLTIIDDTFITNGSANINERSMTVDSELNIFHTNHMIAKKARKDLWGMHTNGRGVQDDMEEAFKIWGKIMEKNVKLEAAGDSPSAPLRGFMRMSPSQKDMD